MAKEKNKNATKSFAMLIVTGVVLAAVTLCWFALSDSSVIKDTNSIFENDASSNANIFYGVDANGDAAIREIDIDHWVKIEDTVITLDNMIPGAEYFYRAEFNHCDDGKKIILSFDGITDTNGSLSSSVEVKRKVASVDVSDNETDVTAGGATVLLYQINNTPFEYYVQSEGKYRIYYSFKFKDETTSGKESHSLTIENVNAVVSD